VFFVKQFIGYNKIIIIACCRRFRWQLAQKLMATEDNASNMTSNKVTLSFFCFEVRLWADAGPVACVGALFNSAACG
jgi:hypothetical protein